jgi:hypothetical protein
MLRLFHFASVMYSTFKFYKKGVPICNFPNRNYKRREKTMKYNLLGNTGVLVSEVALGTMTFGGGETWGIFGGLGEKKKQDVLWIRRWMRGILSALCQIRMLIGIIFLDNEINTREEILYF